MNSKIISTVLILASGMILNCNFIQSLAPTPEAPLASDVTPLATESNTQDLNELPNECNEFTLTPEECANVGTHKYSTSTKILHDQSGNTCQIDNSDIIATIKFLTRDAFSYSDSFGIELEFTRKENNYYEGGYIQPDGKFEWKDTLTFSSVGFTIEAKSYDLEKNEHLCTFIWEQKIITDNLP